MAQKKKAPKAQAEQLVFEMGMEELPTGYYEYAYQIKEKAFDLLRTHGLVFSSAEMHITPRRIVFDISGLEPFQQTKEECIKGPSREQCYDASGKPTPQLQGFLKSKNASLADLIEIVDGKRQCVAIKRTVGGVKTSVVLGEVLPKIIETFVFPRMMFWNETLVRFPRPVRWLLCLYGSSVVKVSWGGLTASHTSYGHRYTDPGKLVVSSATTYKTMLQKKGIVIREDDRKKMIESQLVRIAEKEGWDRERFDSGLIETAARLTEMPYAICGTIKREYLGLPHDVLSTCMKKNQKIFACYSKQGALVASFVAVLDGKRAKTAGIIAGYEGVLESRLKDAAFFIREDSQEAFHLKKKKLADIIFLGKLGTMYQKVERLEEAARHIQETVRFHGSERMTDDEAQALKESASLCKNDLVTHLVFEFPELQGIAGREYLKKEGVSARIYQAVSDHYLPKTLHAQISPMQYDDRSVGRVSVLLSILDRFDTIVGALASGIEISGSEDPYALRRASGGIVKIARSFGLTFSLQKLCAYMYAQYHEMIGSALSVSEEETWRKVQALFKDRILYEANEPGGSVERMILSAVLETACDDIGEVFVRYEALKALYRGKEKDAFVRAVKLVERTRNILKSTKLVIEGPIDSAILSEPAEKMLYIAYEKAVPEVEKQIAQRDYHAAVCALSRLLGEPVHEFFEKVLVNVEDPAVRMNRLRLLMFINQLCTARIADLSLVHGLE